MCFWSYSVFLIFFLFFFFQNAGSQLCFRFCCRHSWLLIMMGPFRGWGVLWHKLKRVHGQVANVLNSKLLTRVWLLDVMGWRQILGSPRVNACADLSTCTKTVADPLSTLCRLVNMHKDCCWSNVHLSIGEGVTGLLKASQCYSTFYSWLLSTEIHLASLLSNLGLLQKTKNNNKQKKKNHKNKK